MLKPLILLATLAVVAGCSTPQSRARANPEMLESFPPEVRAKVEAGEIDLGFTEEMVLMALGKPDRRYSELTEHGQTIVWGYHERRLGSGLSVGVGTGMGRARGGSVYGGGVSVGTGGGRMRPEEKTRVTFSEGQVIAIQQSDR
jgi:hypothetical protein